MSENISGGVLFQDAKRIVYEDLPFYDWEGVIVAIVDESSNTVVTGKLVERQKGGFFFEPLSRMLGYRQVEQLFNAAMSDLDDIALVADDEPKRKQLASSLNAGTVFAGLTSAGRKNLMVNRYVDFFDDDHEERLRLVTEEVTNGVQYSPDTVHVLKVIDAEGLIA